MKKIKPLLEGATVGLIATGSPLSPERWQLGIRCLEKLGFRWRTPFDPSKYYGRTEHGFASESALERVKGFYTLLQDREVSALLAVRGAYGTLDVLPRLDMEQVRAAGKTFIGCSDPSALLLQFAFRAEVPAIHAAVLGSSFADYETDEAAKQSVSLLMQLLSDPDYRYSAELTVIRDGRGEGKLIVSNLTMLLTLLGTPWDISYQGAILVLEDVAESPFRIHRALTQLKLAGKFDKLAGLVFGRFAKCTAANGPSVDDVFQMTVDDITANAAFPVLKGLELGHWGLNIPLPIGCRAEIQGARFRVVESPLVS